MSGYVRACTEGRAFAHRDEESREARQGPAADSTNRPAEGGRHAARACGTRIWKKRGDEARSGARRIEKGLMLGIVFVIRKSLPP